MKNRNLFRQIQSLEALMKRALASTDDIELRSHWARYFCVKTAGLLENGLTEIYVEYVNRTTTPRRVANYASSKLETIQNPKATRFVEVARSFDIHWGSNLEKYLENDGRKDAIDSIMNVRHQIAHGKDTSITIVRITDYLHKAKEVLEFIESPVTS